MRINKSQKLKTFLKGINEGQGVEIYLVDSNDHIVDRRELHYTGCDEEGNVIIERCSNDYNKLPTRVMSWLNKKVVGVWVNGYPHSYQVRYVYRYMELWL